MFMATDSVTWDAKECLILGLRTFAKKILFLLCSYKLALTLLELNYLSHLIYIRYQQILLLKLIAWNFFGPVNILPEPNHFLSNTDTLRTILLEDFSPFKLPQIFTSLVCFFAPIGGSNLNLFPYLVFCFPGAFRSN